MIHIHYYLINALRSTLLEHSYFSSPDYLTVKAWIKATFPFPDAVVLTGPFTYRHESHLRLMGYSFDRPPFHFVVAFFDFLNYFVLTAFSVL